MGKQVGFEELVDWDGHLCATDTVYKIDHRGGTVCSAGRSA